MLIPGLDHSGSHEYALLLREEPARTSFLGYGERGEEREGGLNKLSQILTEFLGQCVLVAKHSIGSHPGHTTY